MSAESEVSWRAASFALLPAVLSVLAQPAEYCTWLYGLEGRFMRISPVVCAFDVVGSMMAIFGLRSLHLPWKDCFRLLVRDRFVSEKPTSSSSRNRSYTLSRWIFFLGATLPQYVRLLTFRNTLGTQLSATCFVAAFVMVEILAVFHVSANDRTTNLEPSRPLSRQNIGADELSDGLAGERELNSGIRTSDIQPLSTVDDILSIARTSGSSAPSVAEGTTASALIPSNADLRAKGMYLTKHLPLIATLCNVSFILWLLNREITPPLMSLVSYRIVQNVVGSIIWAWIVAIVGSVISDAIMHVLASYETLHGILGPCIRPIYRSAVVGAMYAGPPYSSYIDHEWRLRGIWWTSKLIAIAIILMASILIVRPALGISAFKPVDLHNKELIEGVHFLLVVSTELLWYPFYYQSEGSVH